MNGEYKLARAAGGTSHFAGVSVSLNAHTSCDVIDIRDTLADRDLIGSWLSAAELGARQAVAVAGRALELKHIVITDLVATLADSDDDTVWCAAAIAAFRAMGDDSPEPVYEVGKGRWHVCLPNGAILKMSSGSSDLPFDGT